MNRNHLGRWTATLLLALIVAPPTARAADTAAAPTSAPAETAPAANAQRVACVGDSITFGSGIRDRAHNSYPAQLQKMLGDGCQVKNFGVSGATMLHDGDKPYYKQSAYAAALKFQPTVVVIMLGTNDSKPKNWQHHEDFAADYKSLIAAFRSDSPSAAIYLCLPVPVIGAGNYGINEPTMVNEIDPQIRALAAEYHANLLDLHQALDGQPNLFPDRVHPNADGAKLMAAAVYHALTGHPTPEEEAASTTQPTDQP